MHVVLFLWNGWGREGDKWKKFEKPIEERRPWLPDGHSQNFRSYVFGPSGFLTMAPLGYAAKFNLFLFWSNFAIWHPWKSKCLSLFQFTRVMRGNFLLFRNPNDVGLGYQNGARFGFRFLIPGVMHTPKCTGSVKWGFTMFREWIYEILYYQG